MNRATDFQSRVWEAFWEDGNNQDAVNRVVAVVFAEAVHVVETVDEDAPEATVNDGGATGDGWRMACKEIAKRIISHSERAQS